MESVVSRKKKPILLLRRADLQLESKDYLTLSWESAASEFRKSFYSTAYNRSFGGDTEKKYRETEVYLLGKQEFTKTFMAQALEEKVA